MFHDSYTCDRAQYLANPTEIGPPKCKDCGCNMDGSTVDVCDRSSGQVLQIET